MRVYFYMQGGKIDPVSGNNVGLNAGSWERYRAVTCVGIHSTYGTSRLWFDTEKEAAAFTSEYGCDPSQSIADTDAALAIDADGHLITTINGVRYYWSDWGIVVNEDAEGLPAALGDYPALGTGRFAALSERFNRATPWGTDGSSPLDDDEEADVVLTGSDIAALKALLAAPHGATKEGK